MKKTILFLISLFFVSAMYAQYCSTQKGFVAYYTTIDKEKGKTLQDSTIVEKVIDEGERIIVEVASYGDQHSASEVRDRSNRETFIYQKDNNTTEHIILDAEAENEATRKYLASGYLPGQEAKAEEEYKEYSKRMRAEGRISILIKENPKMNEELPLCSYFQKMAALKMGATLKGQYKGKETVHTPAGNFECIKIYMESKAKFLWISHSEYRMDWYAKDVGIVKSETYTKRGKRLTITTLQAIKH